MLGADLGDLQIQVAAAQRGLSRDDAKIRRGKVDRVQPA